MTAPKMLNGLTLKQNRFCDHFIANDGNASAAYRAAYNAENMADTTIWSEASKLLANPLVAERLEELRRRAAIMADITVEALIAKLETAVSLAAETKNSAAYSGAVMAQAKLAGLIVDKREDKLEVSKPKDKPALDELLDQAKPSESVADSAIPEPDEQGSQLTH